MDEDVQYDSAVGTEVPPGSGTELTTRLADYRIRDHSSFDAATSAPREVAGLYAFKYLDGLIELARGVAHDFFARPDLYIKLDDHNLAARLARLDARSGNDERYLSREQREAIYSRPFEGGAEGTEDFPRYRDELLAAAAAFAEWSQATGISMLREAVRSALIPFKEYLTGLRGASIGWSRGRALPALTEGTAYPILRDGGVIAVFGLTRTPQKAWPYREDANGDKVVAEVGKRLYPDADPPWTREGFSAVQRVALRGAEALAIILDFDEKDHNDQDLDLLITHCYTWRAALRAWKTPGQSVGTHEGRYS